MKALRINDRNKIVLQWQYFLIGRGYDLLASGIYDGFTEGATRAFQQSSRIRVDGIAGNETFAKAMLAGFPLIPDTAEKSESGDHWPPPPGYKALTPYQMKQVFGSYEYETTSRTQVRILGSWEQDQITETEIVQLKDISGKHDGGRIRINRLAVKQVASLFAAWEAAGLLHYIKSFDKAFAPSFVEGNSEVLSTHAYGIAFDMNAQWNALGTIPARSDETGSLRPLVQIANQHGFYWGGHFSRKDGMHFELSRLIR